MKEQVGHVCTETLEGPYHTVTEQTASLGTYSDETPSPHCAQDDDTCARNSASQKTTLSSIVPPQQPMLRHRAACPVEYPPMSQTRRQEFMMNDVVATSLDAAASQFLAQYTPLSHTAVELRKRRQKSPLASAKDTTASEDPTPLETAENSSTRVVSSAASSETLASLESRSHPRTCDPPVSRRKKCRPKSCTPDLKVLCRLIAAHQKKPETGSIVSFVVGHAAHRFRVRLSIDLGQNVRCLVFERALDTHPSFLDTSSKGMDDVPFASFDLIFAFNWFSPSGIWDYMSLGFRLLKSPGHIDKEYGLCSELAMSQAKQFLNQPEIHELLEDLKLGYDSPEVSRVQENQKHWKQQQQEQAVGKSPHTIFDGSVKNVGKCPQRQSTTRFLPHVRKITLTGFSMGGSTAHAFAVLLKELKKMPQDLRCVGFGSPRPGNEMFTSWFEQNLTPDSMNIILASEEFVTSPDVAADATETLIVPPEEDMDSTCTLDSVSRAMCSGKHLSCLPSQSSLLSIRSQRILLYDPVSRTPSSEKGFDAHPGLHVLVQQQRGKLMPMSFYERERLKDLDHQHSVETSTFSALFSIAIRGSPFSPDVAHGLDKLHSVLKYYDAMTVNEDA